jgi:TolA-binding protein
MTKTEKIEKLRADRTSTNNRISGVKTQLKRIAGQRGKGERKRELENRLQSLIDERETLGKRIRDLEGPKQPAAPAATAPVSDEDGPAKGEQPPAGDGRETPAEALQGRAAARGQKRGKRTAVPA